ncbi:ABC transporter permease [Streptomyces tubercidicus]|uniref:ABC transporter permease n=1 Tax=Streptomyces tubercidicus TaxID=47759 RepID=UPI002E13B6D3|nr:ABC transporter permease [Streptomyces tubercidicus]
MFFLVLGSLRTRLWQYAGVLVVVVMSSALVTTLTTVLDRVHHASAGGGAEKAAGSLLGLVGGTSGLTAWLLVVNTMSLVVQQRRREIGALRTIGATSRQLRLEIVGETLVISLLGAAAGAGTGLAAAGPALSWLIRNDILEPGPTGGLSLPGFTAGVLCTTGIAVLAAWAATNGPMRISPIAALREAEVERRAMPTGRAIGALVLLGLAWASWDRYGRRNGPHEAINGAMALCLLLILSVWLLIPLLVRPIAALSSGPGRLLSRYSGTLAAANSAAATRRVAAMAGPVLIAAGLGAMLLCHNSVSQATNSRPSVVSVPSRSTEPVSLETAKEHTLKETRLQQARADQRQQRNAVGLRLLMVPLITFSGIGILNTLLLATRRRRQEFAVLRLTGSTRGQLLRMLGWESTVVVLSGLLAAASVVAVTLAGLATRLALPTADLLTLLPWGALAQVALGCAGLGLLGVLVPGLLVLRVHPSQVARTE